MTPNRREFVQAGLGGAGLALLGAPRASGQPAPESAVRGPIFNQDDSEFFSVHTADEMNGETIDAWVDLLKAAGVGTLLTCVNAQCTNYASQVWEPRWARYNPDGLDDQPVLKYLPPERIPGTRRWLENEKGLADKGINFHARAHQRCRQVGLGAWASVRMNDLHDCTLEDSPLLSKFFIERRDTQSRVPGRRSTWTDLALDWTRPDVREHFFKLIVELLEILDPDGIELDWMRFGYHFPIGRELEGGALLTDWLAKVRAQCEHAAGRLGHPVKLGVRVPSTPETARSLGLDAVAWAKAGLVDLVVPTPFWATCEFSMPIRTWQGLLQGTGATLAGGLEVRYQATRSGAARMITPEEARGAAMAVLADGADAVYLFNYFLKGHFKAWSPEQYNASVQAMQSVEGLAKLPRRHLVTYRDVLAPGEPRDDALPAAGNRLTFRLRTGPKPADGAEVLLQWEGDAEPAMPTLLVNSTACPPGTAGEDKTLLFTVPAEAMRDEETVLEVSAADGKPLRLIRVEIGIG